MPPAPAYYPAPGPRRVHPYAPNRYWEVASTHGTRIDGNGKIQLDTRFKRSWIPVRFFSNQALAQADVRAHALRQRQERCRRRDPDNNDDDDAGQGQRRGDDDDSDDDSDDSDDNGGGSGQLARADQARPLSPQLTSASASGVRSLPPRPAASASAPGSSSAHSALSLPPRPRPRGRRSKEGQAKQNARRQLNINGSNALTSLARAMMNATLGGSTLTRV